MYSVGSLKENSPAPVTIDDDKKWSADLRGIAKVILGFVLIFSPEFLKLALIPSPEMRMSASALLEVKEM